MTTLALYKISDKIQGALACIDDDDGSIPADLVATLDALELAFSDKATGLVQYRAGLLAAIDAIDTEKARLAIRSERLKEKADWLKNYLHKCMHDAGITKMDLATHKIWIQNNGRPTISVMTSDIPEEFKKVTVTESFDAQAAYEAWKRGETLPESVVVTVGQHLRIR